MNKEKEIREILVDKLVNNDEYIADMILDYLKIVCFICWKPKMPEYIRDGYCDNKHYPETYMKLCIHCIKEFNFHKCYKCNVYVDKSRCYTFNISMYICNFCIMGGTGCLEEVIGGVVIE